MPYQEPGTCRFFVDQLLWLHSLGLGKAYSSNLNVFDLNPTTISTQASGSANWDIRFNTTTSLYGLNYIAILGHNMASGQHNFNLEVRKDGVAIANPMVSGSLHNDVSINNTWNWTAGGTASGTDAALIPAYDGFSIMMSNTKYDIDYAYDQLMFYNITETYDWKVGCLSLGSFYDMPHSADLKISMERQMDGVKKVRTRGGNDLVDYRYHKPPMWGGLPAWELDPIVGDFQQELARSGRRIWHLSFSYLQDSDIFPVSSSVNWEGVYPDNTSNHNLLLEDDTFYGQVIHKTNGGQLPFIFQPDVNDNTNFAIAKFDMNSFQFSQQAPNLYRISLKIREVW